MSAEKAYVILALFFGLYCTFVTVPFQVPDESNHFFRVYQLSKLQILAERHDTVTGGFLATRLVSEAHQFSDLPFNMAGRVSWDRLKRSIKQSAKFSEIENPIAPLEFTAFANTAVYSPVAYIPQTLAFIVARFFDLNLIMTLYLGRIAALISCIALTYISMKLIPQDYKWDLFIIALAPMCLFEMSSLSADAVTIALAFLIYGLARNIATLKRPPTLPYWALVLTVAACFILCKFAYFLMPMIIVLTAMRYMPSRQHQLILFLFGIAYCAAINSIWGRIIAPIYNTPRGLPTVSVNGQIEFIKNHPFQYFSIIVRDFYRSALFYYDSFIGKLGCLDTELPRWVLNTYAAVFVFVLGTGGPTRVQSFSLVQRLIFTGLFVFTIICVVTGIYISWVPVGADTLDGVQGRYFYPALPALLLVLNKFRLPLRAMIWRHRAILVCITTILIMTSISLFKRYYV